METRECRRGWTEVGTRNVRLHRVDCGNLFFWQIIFNNTHFNSLFVYWNCNKGCAGSAGPAENIREAIFQEQSLPWCRVGIVEIWGNLKKESLEYKIPFYQSTRRCGMILTVRNPQREDETKTAIWNGRFMKWLVPAPWCICPDRSMK